MRRLSQQLFLSLILLLTSCGAIETKEISYVSAADLPPGFYRGQLTIAQENQALKSYELVVEANVSTTNFALLGNFGRSAISFQLVNGVLSTAKPRYEVLSLNPDILFRDLQLLLWPRSSLKHFYGNRLDGDDTHLKLYDEESATSVQITYNAALSGSPRHLILVNSTNRYRLELQSLEELGPNY